MEQVDDVWNAVRDNGDLVEEEITKLQIKERRLLAGRQKKMIRLYNLNKTLQSKKPLGPEDYLKAQKICHFMSHITTCTNAQCPHQNCLSSRKLIAHSTRCTDESCVLCLPLRRYIKMEQQAVARAQEHAFVLQHFPELCLLDSLEAVWNDVRDETKAT